MTQNLKNWLIKKLGGVTQKEIDKARKIEWICEGFSSRKTVLPVELNAETWEVPFAPEGAMESCVKHKLLEKVLPYILIERDSRIETIRARIMVLPYEETET
jgi:hypothetical protein